MPGGNGTGPAGMGSISGRGLGFCAGNSQPGYAAGTGTGFNRSGRGFGAGRGCGRGWGFRNFFGGSGFGSGNISGFFNGIRAELTPDKEREILSNRKAMLNTQIENLNRRITELEGQK